MVKGEKIFVLFALICIPMFTSCKNDVYSNNYITFKTYEGISINDNLFNSDILSIIGEDYTISMQYYPNWGFSLQESVLKCQDELKTKGEVNNWNEVDYSNDEMQKKLASCNFKSLQGNNYCIFYEVIDTNDKGTLIVQAQSATSDKEVLQEVLNIILSMDFSGGAVEYHNAKFTKYNESLINEKNEVSKEETKSVEVEEISTPASASDIKYELDERGFIIWNSIEEADDNENNND